MRPTLIADPIGQSPGRKWAGSFTVQVALVSLILLIPCFWQRRIQAIDLQSHIYNSWLAQQINLDKAPGLTIVPISTNVLFDLILSRLFETFGADAAQRIAVSVSVLIFFWGAFALIAQVNRGRFWYLAPCLMMLSYGWAFHMGFCNFYLAAGLSLWALWFSAKRGIAPQLVAAALLIVAYTAHAMPPAWAICVVAYTRIAGTLSWRRRQALLALTVGGIVAMHFWINARYHTFSSFQQVLEASGLDQVWVFGSKYIAISVGLGILWGFLLLRVSYVKGLREMAGDIYFQISVLMAIGILLTPTLIELPQYDAPLSFITERMTMLYGVVICTFLAAAKPPQWMRAAFIPLALIYFSFIYADTNALNRLEKQMEFLTSNLTLQDRVFSSLEDPTSRVQLFGPAVDRVCLGRCISYTNYEPPTLQFRIRAKANNPLLVTDIRDRRDFQDGGYIVKAADLPLYQIIVCGRELCLRKLAAGDVTTHQTLIRTPSLW